MTGRAVEKSASLAKKPGRCCCSRNGFILPLVFGAVAVLTLFFFIMSFLSSGQTQTATHFIDSARSLSMAKAGAEWALAKYASGSYECDTIGDVLFGNSITGGEFDLHPEELEKYVENELNGRLDVKMRIYDISPLPIPEKLKGFPVDPVEKSGKIEFTAIATIGKASRKVRIRKGFKVVMMVHPVLAKFTLFIRDRLANQEINVLERKSASFGFDNGAPIILNNQGFDESGNNLSFKVVKPSNQEFDLSLVNKSGLAKLVQSSGWVFMNSKSIEPWLINLSGSGDYAEFDDRLLLRVGMTQRLDLEAQEDFIAIKEHSTGEKILALYEKFQGMKTDYESRNEDGDVQRKPCDVLHLRYLFPDTPPKSSLIRLFGTGTKFSPTLVLGPVDMQYMRMRGIDVEFQNAGPNGKWLYQNVIIPGFSSQGDFENTYRPHAVDDTNINDFARLMKIDRNNPGPSYAAYSKIMTVIERAPFIQALDYIMSSPENGKMLNPNITLYSVPQNAVDGANSSDLRPWVGNSDSLRDGKGEFRMEGTTLYSGKLVDIKGCKEFQAKITTQFASFKELEEGFYDQRTAQLRIPGIVYIGEADFDLTKPLDIINPGILICGGSVHIKAGVKSKHPFTIVSLKDIDVETSQPVEAHLICLMGTFRANKGFNIKGGLAACSIETAGMKDHAKNITFVPAHDPYSNPDKWKKKSAYRYQLSQEEEYYVEGGKM